VGKILFVFLDGKEEGRMVADNDGGFSIASPISGEIIQCFIFLNSPHEIQRMLLINVKSIFKINTYIHLFCVVGMI